MFLKTLTLKGFKSFAETTSLDFEPGVTVVVGPNGSGKSNIVDAVAWVLGAQGARTIRSNKMEDVIFAGTAKKAALGRAEVALTIDNTAGLLPIEFSEVTISRTLFRSGDSEYAINGVACRLLDIQELLSDTGVGRQQHVIVSQGQLAAILDSRPEDRRTTIEEAAGILKYRKRRERAQRRLEATDANFVRLVDLLREIRRQLRPLERQADAARKHEGMTNELRALRLYLAGRELAGLQIRAETQARVRNDLSSKERELRDALAKLDADVVVAEGQLSAAGGVSIELTGDPFSGQDLGEVLARTESAFQKARGQLAFLGERRRLIERDRNAFLDQGVVETLSSEAAKIAAELADMEARAATLPPEQEELDVAEALLGTERAEFLSEWGSDTSAVPDPGSRTAAQVRSERAGAQQALDRARADRVRLEARARSLEERHERLVPELESHTAEMEAAALLLGIGGNIRTAEIPARAEHQDGMVDARRLAEIAERDADAGLRDANERRLAADGELRAWTARADALAAALDEARARVGAQRLAGIDGIVGTVLDLVEIDEGWEAAFEAAIGEAVAAVVVSSPRAARLALERLHAEGAGGAVLALGAFKVALRLAAVDALGEPVRAHVRSAHTDVSQLLDVLLARSVAVDGDWTAALDAALAVSEAVVVTRSGDRFSSAGWRAGAGSTGATGAALDEARANAAEAEVAAESARRAVESAQVARDTAVATHRDAQRAEQTAQSEHARSVARLESTRAALARLQSDRDELEAEIAAVDRQIGEIADRVDADARRVAELDASLPSLVEAEHALAQRQMLRREASQRLDQRAYELSSKRRNLEVRAASLEERRRVLTARASEIEERLSRSVAEREAAEIRRTELDLSVMRVEALHKVVARRVETLGEGLTEVRDRRRKQNEAARAATTRLDGLRRSRSEAEMQLRQLLERGQRAEIDETEIRLRIETLVEQIRREFDVEPTKAVEAQCPPLVDGTSPTTRVRDLERELRLMGPINPLALEEFTVLQERHQLIATELEDVKTARRDLRKVITAIDAEIVVLFGAAFRDVADSFRLLFEMLFPGGTGSIRLTDPDDLLNTGVEVEARPSGKNVRKLSLLSGGERSLTALAFLFAVFRSRPSPFYLLDEVEAALDDVNLDRFISLLHEFREEAQLLVVSHQKRTMEAADCLYGVSMQPGGSSKVVSERITERPIDDHVLNGGRGKSGSADELVQVAVGSDVGGERADQAAGVEGDHGEVIVIDVERQSTLDLDVLR